MISKYVPIILLCSFISCKNKKENILVEKAIPEKIDSLSRNKEFQSKELFIVQHERKGNRNFIKISTSEYFDKDSASFVLRYKEKIIVYYSDFFSSKREDIHSQITIYEKYIYNDNKLSIFHPQYSIFELNSKGEIKKTKKEQWKNLFKYGNTKEIEEIK